MKYQLTATGTVDAAGDEEILEIAHLAESQPDAPDDAKVEIREIGNPTYPEGRLVYVTPGK